jgi:Fic-DOC domain mobile mystery protein B
MGLDVDYIDGQTPIDEDEKEGLLIETISTRSDLDEFEQKNIEKAVEWTLENKFTLDRILGERFIKEVHKQMFDEVWKWAGKFRRTNKNLGVDWIQIPISLRQLLDNCRYWIQNQTFSEDEIAIRFSYGLVWIHLFPNGNGRHSRLCADILVTHVFNKRAFGWGGTANLSTAGETRTCYLDAIRKADQGDYTDLIRFAKS